MDMRVTFQEESFNEKCFNKIFQGLSFKWIGLELSRVKGIRIKEIVEVERIENYKLPLLMFLLEDDSLLHVEIMNDEIKSDFQSMSVYDMSIVLKYGMQVRTVILNFGSKQNSNFQRSFGSVYYNTQIVNLSGLDRERMHEEISQKISSGCPLDERDKLNLIFLPFMKNSLPFNEGLPKVMSLLERMKDEEERIAYLTVISEIISRLIGKQGVEVLKEYLMDTEVGIRIRDEGNKEGMRESIIIILLEKFNVLPDDIYYAIAKQNNEDTLMKWLQKLTNICSIDELKKMLFNIK
jgi:hypothetical protein